MRQTRRGVHWIGLLLGLSLSLGGVVLSAPQFPSTALSQARYIGNRNSKVFHKADCATLKRSSVRNQVPLVSRGVANSQGFTACQVCKPDQEADDAKFEEDDGRLRFSRDIAPILAGNCMGCHNPEEHKGEFDLTTFQNMMKGSQSGEVIVPGKPDESLLVELVVSRKMPRGGNDRRLAEASIEKIQRWVREGARLDAGVSPTATLDKIVPSTAEMRRIELAQLSPEERDQRLEAVARERWKQAGAAEDPRMDSGKNFVLFSQIPENRAKATLKALEAQRSRLGSLLGPDLVKSLAGPEKVSVYVFNDINTFAEFIRGVERREIEEGAQSHARLDIESPYLVAIDPLAGGEDPRSFSTRSSKEKDDEELGGPVRSLTGLLSESLGKAVTLTAGKPPAWLAEGLGAYLALQVEPKSPYYGELRRLTAQQYQLGWTTKANEALGDQAGPDVLRALGFSALEWLGMSFRQQLPMFVRSLIEDGPRKLDDIIKSSFGPRVTREQFLGVWGRWVAQHYGRYVRRR